MLNKIFKNKKCFESLSQYKHQHLYLLSIKYISNGSDKKKSSLPAETIVKVIPKLKNKTSLVYGLSYRDRNYLTGVRAMSEYLLKPSDLDNLPTFQRRSPYEYRKIDVYLRSDVERQALKIWGNHETLMKEIAKRREQNYANFDFNKYSSLTKAIKKYLSLIGITNYKNPFIQFTQEDPQTKNTSDKNSKSIFQFEHFKDTSFVIWIAITINFFNFIGKSVAYIYTGSHSLFAEAVHSLADTLNQLILVVGIRASLKKADSSHPYGYLNMKYVSSLISGVGIFCFGCGLSVYHGIMALINPHNVESLNWVFAILATSFISEGATLLLSINSVKRNSRKKGMSFMDYVLSSQDPSVNVLLLEDLAAVLGVGIASLSLTLNYFHSHHYLKMIQASQNPETSNILTSASPETGQILAEAATAASNHVIPIYDAIGSLSIGALLGVVASFIIYTNSTALVGKSIPLKSQQQMVRELENDLMVRAVHDVKATTLGGNLVKFKAEVDIDGKEVSLVYLDSQDLLALLKEMQNMQSVNQVEQFILKHGENIVDLLGAEIDRIEQSLKKKHPEIRHVDLEIL